MENIAISNIKEAEKKIRYAEFLMARDDRKNFLPAISRHVIEAANLAGKALLDIDDKSASSPQLMSKALEKLGEGPAEEFSKQYVQIFKLGAKQGLTEQDVRLSLNQVRKFTDWVQKEYGDGDIVEPLPEQEPEPSAIKIEKPQEVTLSYLAERAKAKEEVAPLPDETEEPEPKKKSFFKFWK